MNKLFTLLLLILVALPLSFATAQSNESGKLYVTVIEQVGDAAQVITNAKVSLAYGSLGGEQSQPGVWQDVSTQSGQAVFSDLADNYVYTVSARAPGYLTTQSATGYLPVQKEFKKQPGEAGHISITLTKAPVGSVGSVRIVVLVDAPQSGSAILTTAKIEILRAGKLIATADTKNTKGKEGVVFSKLPIGEDYEARITAPGYQLRTPDYQSQTTKFAIETYGWATWLPIFMDIVREKPAISSITHNLYLELRSSEVVLLQQKLRELGYFPSATQPTGYFGQLTLKAVKRFQAKYGIRQTGYVGPVTKAKLNELFGTLKSSPTPGPTPTPSSTSTPTPIPTPNGEKIIKTVNEQESTFLIQKINPDSIEGLWYQSYPIPSAQGSPRTLHIGDDIGYACKGVSEKLTSIDFSGQEVTFTKMIIGEQSGYRCGFCLSANTLIDTPSGPALVKDIQVGMPIWTTDTAGHRVSGVVMKTSNIPVPPTHQMVHLVLDDGRALFVSPGHPTVDGRTVGNLAPGDQYNGASVVSVERVPYNEGATYDVLPSGETGFYWANGILLDSTLH